MDSTTTAARGMMVGSCRPCISMVTGSPFLFTVSWAEPMEGVAFTAALSRISLPSEMPPSIPPAWFVFFSMPP